MFCLKYNETNYYAVKQEAISVNYEVIVIGAGASGLVAAIGAARQGSKVLIIEQKEKVGKKILATGNGKCNYTNLHQSPDCYRSDDSSFPMKVLSSFNIEQTLQFFEELGIYPKNRNGYVYPHSEQGASVVQVLVMECERLGIDIHCEEKVKDIKESPKGNMNFLLISSERKEYRCKKVILAAGGCASPKLGSDGSGYWLAEKLGHSLIQPLPALVQLKSPAKFCKQLSGVRVGARVTAMVGNQVLSQEEGEILFTDYGISGIAIMQLSRFVAKALYYKENVIIGIDFLPSLSEGEIESLYVKRVEHQPNRTLEEMMIGLFNVKLAQVLLLEGKLSPQRKAKDMSRKELLQLVTQTKHFAMPIHGTNDFDNAQVSAGGISTKEVNPCNLESKLVKGLYLVGEVLDVDGTCGGYNLQWAWSSGYLAGVDAGKG